MEGNPHSPYREGRPLSEIIPPDRRKLKVAVLVAASLFCGGALVELGRLVIELTQQPTPRPLEPLVSKPPPPPRPVDPMHLAPVQLRGADGALHIVPPPGTPSVIHVWLQGCQDCMPAFEAMQALDADGGLKVAVHNVNVAYGRADVEWAKRYGVSENLLFDSGGAGVVKPLEIGSFTTLVLDHSGNVVHRDRPDRAGYAARVRAAVNALIGSAPKEGAIGADEIESVLRVHQAELKARCWDGRRAATVTITAEIAADGAVDRATAKGDAADVGACLAREIRRWRFRRAAEPTTVSLPFSFVSAEPRKPIAVDDPTLKAQ